MTVDPDAERAAIGNMEAFERIYRRYYSRVHSICAQMTRNASQADDLTVVQHPMARPGATIIENGFRFQASETESLMVNGNEYEATLARTYSLNSWDTKTSLLRQNARHGCL